MALRQIRVEGDEILRKKCKEVKEINDNIKELVDDMIDTMNSANGCGLAAPQVGILKRIVIIDVGNGPYVLINPKIVETKGEQINPEACLSIPGKSGVVKRPEYVKAEATNLDGKRYFIEGTELLAIALCHETDHLDGKLYVDIAQNIVQD